MDTENPGGKLVKGWGFLLVESAKTSIYGGRARHHRIARSPEQRRRAGARIGYETQDAVHAVNRLMIADMDLSKADGLAKLAKDAAAIENITPGEGLEKLLLALESGASRGLRTRGIIVDLNKSVELPSAVQIRSRQRLEIITRIRREAMFVSPSAPDCSRAYRSEQCPFSQWTAAARTRRPSAK